MSLVTSVSTSEYRHQKNFLFLATIFLCGLFWGTGALAQLTNDNNTPSGSPVNTSGSSGSNNGQSNGSDDSQIVSTGPYQPDQIGGGLRLDSSSKSGSDEENSLLDIDNRQLKKAKPGEYQEWITDVTGLKLDRFGSDLLLPSNRDFATPATSTIPPDYALNVGDVISVSLTGSLEGSAEFEIDRDGNVFLPNVGAVSLTGVRYRDLKDRISAAVGRQYRGYDVSVSISSLRGVRVYVTGFAVNPGAYTVSSLSTLVNAVLKAGGPNSGGSFRSAKLYRNGKEVADFDLYQLLRDGNRALDPILQNEDVIFLPPVGNQVAVIGSVNEAAIYEARPGETVEDLVRYAGGATALADASRTILYRLSDQDTVGSQQLDRTASAVERIEAGDILQILPLGSLVRPLERQQAVVRLEGEVNKPGNYYVPPGTPLGTVIEMAGGLTSRAFPFGTQFERESVRAQQRRGFLEAIEQMEMALAAAPLSSDRALQASEREAQINFARAFIAKLKDNEPDGRLVLGLTAEMSNLPPDILLENNDRIYVPPRINSVGVFGAVYRPATFLMNKNKRLRVKDYVELSGGPIRGADKGNIFVVRANGSVLTRSRGAMGSSTLPGDTIFVPIKTQNLSFLSKLADISQIIFQFGLSAAALAAIQ
ncbi:SLBB domain-containing protein [Sneathiella sp.]|uniref:SLBB domain-containing protein n=1 Tax=Sneathiella sp. TaxID=1964365 RepID=UPI003563E320